MSDSTKQGNREAASSASALGARLTMRGTEPLGVIDVRHAKQKYFRIAGWLARHGALLEQLRSRYGIEEPFAGDEHTLAMQRPLGEQVNVFSNTIQSLSLASQLQAAAVDAHPLNENRQPSSLAQIIEERTFNRVSEPDASSDREFRISRRPPPMLHASDTATPTPPTARRTISAIEASSSVPFEPAALDSSSTVIRTVETSLMTRDASGQENRVPIGNERAGKTSSIVQSEAFEGSTASEQPSMPLMNERAGTASSIVRHETSDNTNAQELHAPTSTGNKQAGTSLSIAQQEADRNVNERVDTDLPFAQRKIGATNEQRANVRDQVNKIPPVLPLEMVRGSSTQAPLSSQGSDAGRSEQKSDITSAGPTTVSVIAANEQSPTAAPIVQPVDREIANQLPTSLRSPAARQVDGATILPKQLAGAASSPEYLELPGQQNVSGARTSQRSPSTVAAPEIRRDSFNQEGPRIVWREPQAGPQAAGIPAQESRSASSVSPVVQSGPTDPYATNQQTGRDDLAALPQSQSREIQLEQISPRVIRDISERVIRAITRDLKFERERRGVTKWR